MRPPPLFQKYWNVLESKSSINLTIQYKFLSGFIDSKLPRIYIYLHQFGPLKKSTWTVLLALSTWLFGEPPLPLVHPHGL